MRLLSVCLFECISMFFCFVFYTLLLLSFYCLYLFWVHVIFCALDLQFVSCAHIFLSYNLIRKAQPIYSPCINNPLLFRVSYVEFLRPFAQRRQLWKEGNNMHSILTHPQAELPGSITAGKPTKGLEAVTSKLKQQVWL